MKRSTFLILVPLVLLALLVLGFALFYLRDPTPLLNRDRFDEALRRWQDRGISNYDLDLVVDGDGGVHEEYRVQVRKNQVVFFEHNGLPANRAGSDYAVPDIFNWIDQELVLSTEPAVVGGPVGALLKAEFHPELGYPVVFKRLASRGMSRFIHVENFTITTDDSAGK